MYLNIVFLNRFFQIFGLAPFTVTLGNTNFQKFKRSYFALVYNLCLVTLILVLYVRRLMKFIKTYSTLNFFDYMELLVTFSASVITALILLIYCTKADEFSKVLMKINEKKSLLNFMIVTKKSSSLK